MRADVTVGVRGYRLWAIAVLTIRHNPRLITFTTGFLSARASEIDVAVASAEPSVPVTSPRWSAPTKLSPPCPRSGTRRARSLTQRWSLSVV